MDENNAKVQDAYDERHALVSLQNHVDAYQCGRNYRNI